MTARVPLCLLLSVIPQWSVTVLSPASHRPTSVLTYAGESKIRHNAAQRQLAGKATWLDSGGGRGLLSSPTGTGAATAGKIQLPDLLRGVDIRLTGTVVTLTRVVE